MSNTNNSFSLYDKALDIVTALFGEEITDQFKISVENKVTKVIVPMWISLLPLAGRNDITVTLLDTTSEILVLA